MGAIQGAINQALGATAIASGVASGTMKEATSNLNEKSISDLQRIETGSKNFQKENNEAIKKQKEDIEKMNTGDPKYLTDISGKKTNLGAAYRSRQAALRAREEAADFIEEYRWQQMEIKDRFENVDKYRGLYGALQNRSRIRNLYEGYKEQDRGNQHNCCTCKGRCCLYQIHVLAKEQYR